jgi:hypothetical protein
MSDRINIRNKIVEQLKKLAAFDDTNVQLYKLDRVDKTPFAAVYLGRLTSELDDMNSSNAQGVSRSLRVIVDFHLDTTTGDADAILSGYLEEMERHVLTAAKKGEFEGRDASLEEAEFHPLDASRERKGDMSTTWLISYDETVSTVP